MNEETTTEATESTETTLLSGEATTTAFDAFYSEGALESVPDGSFKNFIQKYDSPQKADEGFRNMQKLLAAKGYHQPAEDASDDEKQAWEQHRLKVLGVPQTVEEYNVNLPEGVALPDELMGQLKEYGVKNGIPPANIEALIPFQTALQQAQEQMRVQMETEKLVKAFGSEGELAKMEGELKEFAKSSGYDLNSQGVKTAEFWMAMRDLKTANAKIAQLTGEDVAVKGASTDAGSAADLLNDMLTNKEHRYHQALMNPTHRDHKAAQAEFSRLSKLKYESQKRK